MSFANETFAIFFMVLNEGEFFMSKRSISFFVIFFILCSSGFTRSIFAKKVVTIVWEPNTELDLNGYKIYYGNNTRKYHSAVDVGLHTSHTFENLQEDEDYFFAITAYDTSRNESEFSEELSIIHKRTQNWQQSKRSNTVKSGYNFPNPFAPGAEMTTIHYLLSQKESVTIKIHDVAGNELRSIVIDRLKSEGEHLEDKWDGKDNNGQFVANGIYYCTIDTRDERIVITIAVLR